MSADFPLHHFELHPLSKENIKALLTRAVTDVEKGLGSYHAEMDEEALSFWLRSAAEMPAWR